MIEPGSTGDWTLLAGALGSLSVLAACAHRWVIPEMTTSEQTERPPRAERSARSMGPWTRERSLAAAFYGSPRERVSVGEREGDTQPPSQPL